MMMTTDAWIVLLGSVGGFCTTFAFVPQLIKIWKQGGRDLSYGMLSLYLLGVLLWRANARAGRGSDEFRHCDFDRYCHGPESLDCKTR
jgi:hypothetical protein